MKRKVFSFLIIVFLLGTVLAGCGGSAENTSSSSSASGEKVVELNLGHTLAPDSHYHAMATKMAELVKDKSNGRIKINVFPQSQLGGEVKMIQAARTGSLGLLITAQAPLTTTIKEYAIFDLPYLFDSVDEANKVLASPIGDKFLDMLPEHDLVGLGWLSAMERNVFSSKPVQTVDDLNGFKIRVMQSPGYVQTYEALGAQPTPMAYSEVYTALQQGVVDGGDTSPDQFVMDKFIEVADYYNITRVHYLPALLIGSKKIWEGLTEEQQKIIQEAADEAIKYGINYYEESYDKSIKKMKEAGVEVVQTDVSTLKQAAQKVNDPLLNEIPNGQELFEEIQAAKKE